METITFYAREAPVAQRLDVFSATLAALAEDYGRWDTPWGAINRFQRLDGEIESRFDDLAPSLPIGMASGRWGALASFGAKRFDTNKRLYGYSGNSFVAVVEFGDKVRAKTLLAGGQSGHPGSPHFSDQAPYYAERRFKEAAYYREDVQQRARERYRPGER
jgi:acyl-homoserine lactone acylase PvdQ